MSDTLMTNLRKLSLRPMAEALALQLEQPATYDGLSFTERLTLLVDHEVHCRRRRRQQRLISRAGLRLAATLGEIEYRAGRGLERRQIAELGHCDWIGRAQNLLVTGPCGSGKTYVACALAHAACMLNLEVRYMRLPLLFERCGQARALGEYSKFIARIGSVPLLVIDDFGLRPLDAADRHDLVEVMDRRYGQVSTAVISQLPVDRWHDLIGDATLADAFLDRLVHNAHRIRLRGESMRKRNAVQDTDDTQPDPDTGAGP